MGLSIGMASLGAVIPLLSRSLPVMLLSALVFGFAFLNVPAAVTAMIRSSLRPDDLSLFPARLNPCPIAEIVTQDGGSS